MVSFLLFGLKSVILLSNYLILHMPLLFAVLFQNHAKKTTTSTHAAATNTFSPRNQSQAERTKNIISSNTLVMNSSNSRTVM